jgi:hypothetical protein
MRKSVTTRKRKHYWVLRQSGGPLRGWYWCGAGNPMFTQAREGTPYLTRKEAERQARYLAEHWDTHGLVPDKVLTKGEP